MLRPGIPAAIQQRFGFVYRLLDNKYYMDWFNEHVLARAARVAGAASGAAAMSASSTTS
jgi:NADH-quinone oxidoreductase subunit L